MEEELMPIAGAVHTLRVLADSTVAVTLHFEPKDRMKAMAMMGTPGSPIACARLVDGFAQAKEKPRDVRGPLCKEACDMCANPAFHRWIRATVNPASKNVSESWCAEYVRTLCEVASRKDLDVEPVAAARFVEELRKPFQAWVKAQA